MMRIVERVFTTRVAGGISGLERRGDSTPAGEGPPAGGFKITLSTPAAKHTRSSGMNQAQGRTVSHRNCPSRLNTTRARIVLGARAAGN